MASIISKYVLNAMCLDGRGFLSCYTHDMRLLGIDYGEKRIGIALSDERGSIASPLSVIENKREALAKIVGICQKESVTAIVLGESKDYKGNDNAIMGAVRIFSEDLKEKTGLPVYLEPEFMTSAQAVRIQGEKKDVDASAAAIILQSYIDKKYHDIN